MNQDEYFNHPLRETANRILAIIDNPKFSTPAVADVPQPAYCRDKIIAVSTRITQLLDEVPAAYASFHALSQLNSSMHGIISELQNFLNNDNVGHIVNAGAIMDQQVQALMWGFTEDPSERPDSALPKLLALHSKEAKAAIAALDKHRGALQIEFNRQANELSDLNRRLQEMTESAARERAEAGATVAKLELAFAEKENERAARHAEALDSLKGQFNDAMVQAKDNATNVVTQLKLKQAEAEQIVQVVGNVGVTGNYQKIAIAETSQANLWRWLTVGLFVVAVVVAVTTFIRHWTEEITVPNAMAIGVRLLYAIAIAAPALYTARESARHRSNADRARQTELELASIGPFIELMPDEKKTAIREELAKRYFGNKVEEHTVEMPLDAKGLIAAVTDLVKTFKK